MFTNRFFIYATAGAAIIGAFAYWAHDLKERGRIEAISEINQQARQIETAQAKKKIEELNAAFSATDAAMAQRSEAYGAANEKAILLITETSKIKESNGNGKERGNLEPSRDNPAGMLDQHSRGDSDRLRVPPAENPQRAEPAQKCTCPGRYETDSRRNLKNKLIKLAHECDNITADYNALLAICRQ